MQTRHHLRMRLSDQSRSDLYLTSIRLNDCSLLTVAMYISVLLYFLYNWKFIGNSRIRVALDIGTPNARARNDIVSEATLRHAFYVFFSFFVLAYLGRQHGLGPISHLRSDEISDVMTNFHRIRLPSKTCFAPPFIFPPTDT